MHQLGALVDHTAQTEPRREGEHPVHDLVRVGPLAAHVSEGEQGALMDVLEADLGRGDEALAMLIRAEAAAGEDRALLARVLLNRGLVEADSGRFGPAETSLARAATLAREVGDDSVVQGAVDNMARVASLTGRGGARDVLGAVVEHLRKGDLASALQAAEEAVLGDSSHVAALNALGSVLLSKGDLPESIEAFQRALKEDPARAEIYGNLGRAYESAGNLPAAIGSYESLLRHWRGPEPAQLAVLRHHLEELKRKP